MRWLLFAFSGPFFWAISTHIDKYLVEKYFKESSTAVLMVFTALIGLLMLPVIWYFVPGIFSFSLTGILVMMSSGVLYMGAMLFYLQALQSEEASVVAPMFQFSVIWGALLAYLLIGETLSMREIAGVLIVLVAALSLSFDPRHFRRFRSRFVLIMLAATFALALSSVIFKFFAVREEFWSTTFWTYAGEAIFGIALLMYPPYLRQFSALIRSNPGAVLGINGANELINLGGGLGVRFAFLLAPVALVQVISSTTTLFIFGIGVVLTLVAPRLGREDLSLGSLVQKGIAALLVAAGIVLMNV